jgi:amino acid adenylation domain-containing protein
MMDMVQRLSRLSPGQRRLLERKLERQGIDISRISSGTSKTQTLKKIEAVEEKEYYSLSSSQKRIYILNLFTEYTLSLLYQVDGHLEPHRFQEIFTKLTARHESLRTSFVTVAGEPVQRIHDTVDFEIEYYDLNNGDNVFSSERFVRPFDLSRAPLIQVVLIKLSGSRHLFLMNMHHLISDGVSRGILTREFIRLYRGETPPELTVRYRDFSLWQRREFNRERAEYRKQEAFWLDRFGGELPVLNMPVDYPRSTMQRFESRKLGFAIEAELLGVLKEFAVKRGASFYMVLLAVCNTLLFRCTDQEDIVIGTITAGREQEKLQELVGVFINPLAMRNFPAAHKTFGDFLQELKQDTLAVYENQSYPFGDLLEKVVEKKDFSRNPLFDVMFVYRNLDIDNLETGGLRFSLYEAGQEREGHAQQDITFWAVEEENRIRIDLEYCTALFKQETMERFFGHFINILRGAAAGPGLKLPELEMMGREEKQRVLVEFNDTRAPFPTEKNIDEWFEEQADRTPGHVAVVGPAYGARCGAQRRGVVHITYRELSIELNKLSHLLRSKGPGPDTIVGLLPERSLEVIIGILGILKGGCAYMPIDPDYPQERIDYMLADSNARVLLAAPGDQVKELESPVEIIYISDVLSSSPSVSTSASSSACRVSSANLAYVIYTSGTTGRPKGVMVDRRNVAAYLYAFYREFEIHGGHTVLQLASCAFDVFIEEIFPVLLRGGKIVIPDPDERMDIPMLSWVIFNHGVNVIDCTPLLLNEFNKIEKLGPLDIIISGGDVLKGEYVDRLLEAGRVYNTYGPTESTVCATYYRYRGGLQSSIPLGKPIANYRVYILDKNHRVQPVGVMGELCVGGAGVMRGYLNRPELTAEKFDHDLWDFQDYHDENQKLLRGVQGAPRRGEPIRGGFVAEDVFDNSICTCNRQLSPLAEKSPPGRRRQKIYKTGDLARWLDDGNVEFLGRIDQQIKIRGFRVELGEIESQLLSHPGIKEAVVLDKEDINGNKYLCAFIVRDVLNGAGKIVLSELRAYLSAKLPAYMVPANFVVLERIPLTPNGKVDMKVLYNYDQEENIVAGTGYEAPTREVEKKLAEIWSEILLKKRIGINDNFFDLGGHSLLAMRVISRIKEVFKVKIPLITIFQRGTIRGIADMILEAPLKKQESTGKRSKRKGLIQPFELDNAPLLRSAVVKLEPDRHFFYVEMHHIITDGISLDIIRDEFFALYSGDELEELPLQYKDFSKWQEDFFKSEQFQKQQEYWLSIFSGGIPGLNLPLDYPRPEVKGGEGKMIHVNVGSELSARLKRFALKEEVTLFMLFLAVYTILLGKTAGQEDIVVGTPVSGRTTTDVIRMVGMFVNTLALRNKPLNRLTFYEYLETVKQGTLDALENQEYPFEILVGKLNLAGDTARNPIFDTMFALEQFYEQDSGRRDDEIMIMPYEFEYTGSMFDLVLGVVVEDKDIRLHFKYDIHLFREDTVRRMADHFIAILSGVVQSPEARIENINMSVPFEKSTPYAELDVDSQENRLVNPGLSTEPLSRHETLSQQQGDWILYEFNDTRMEYPEEITIHQLFEQQAAAAPLRVAVICGDRQMTYGELNRRCDQLAGLLLEKGIAAESCVGVMMERSLELMVGILGILKAGGCYLPIDPRYPEEHSRFLLSDASINILLTQSHSLSLNMAKYVDCVVPLHGLEHGERGDRGSRHPGSPVPVKPGQSAYVIYTSGSTGRPKGVIVEHQAVVERLTWMQRTYPLSAADTVLQKTVFTFDVSIIELFGWFMGGARLYLLETSAEKDLRNIVDIIVLHNVTAVSFTPTILNAFFLPITSADTRKLVSLKWIFSAGEQLPEVLVEKWHKLAIPAKLENLYGPTEATVYASYYSCVYQPYTGPVPIGKPLGNSRLYILDENEGLIPPETVGELYLAGGGLSRGYLNRPGLTGEKFLPDPFFPGGRMYRTGDYAKLLPEGQAVYLGRMDNQVKIKGIRIELDEIEAALLKHPGISEAAVIVQDDPMGSTLVAYIVPREDLTLKELRVFLLEKLPDYMVPSGFFKLDKMPVSSSGKLARKLLPELGTGIEADICYAAPRTEVEHQLVQLWAETLRLDKIGIDHNFFEMGGDSLKGNLFLAKISGPPGTSLMIKDLFEAPTIRKFAELLSRSKITGHKLIAAVEKKDYYPASSAQKRLFVIQRLDHEDISYNLSMGMIIKGRLDKERLHNTIKKLVQRHESLRTRFEIKEGEIVQVIEDNPVFEVEFFETGGQPPVAVQEGDRWNPQDIEKIIRGDIQLRHIYGEAQDHLLSTVKLTRVKRKAREI